MDPTWNWLGEKAKMCFLEGEIWAGTHQRKPYRNITQKKDAFHSFGHFIFIDLSFQLDCEHWNVFQQVVLFLFGVQLESSEHLYLWAGDRIGGGELIYLHVRSSVSIAFWFWRKYYDFQQNWFWRYSLLFFVLNLD